jgi:glutathione synthase/RimK-type ligase-like ATP-grasp enzyme
MAAAFEKGVSIELIDPRQVTPSIVGGRLSLTGIDINPASGVILPRQGSQISSSSIVILSHLQAMGFCLINNIESILTSRNKFLTLQRLAAAGINIPASIFINSKRCVFTRNRKPWGIPGGL